MTPVPKVFVLVDEPYHDNSKILAVFAEQHIQEAVDAFLNIDLTVGQSCITSNILGLYVLNENCLYQLGETTVELFRSSKLEHIGVMPGKVYIPGIESHERTLVENRDVITVLLGQIIKTRKFI